MNNENTSNSSLLYPDILLEKKLEIGRSTFKDRIQRNCVYVDKTPYIFELINRDSNCFLSRPRRFGKSLLISTIKEIFSGSKELFKQCWIYDKILWEEHPIIHIDFIELDYFALGLERAICKKLDQLAEQFNFKLIGETVKEKFLELIQKTAKAGQVVILIDEYDKPIVDYIENIPEAQKNRDILKSFYSVLKSQTNNIRFLLITGVAKFTRVSIFSDLNHLKDISLHPKYSKMLGYTKEEIEQNFSGYISAWEKKTGQKSEELFEKLKYFYNGYSWDGENFLYNPFSILNFFDSFIFDNYWFISGSPTFLVKIMKNADVSVPQYEKLVVGRDYFEKFDLESIYDSGISSLLFQTGYLTIKAIENDENFDTAKYILTYPNREVRTSFLRNLLQEYSYKSNNDIIRITEDIEQSLNEYKIDHFIQCIKILLSSIPYNIHLKNREAYYHSIIYVVLKLAMIDVKCEIQSSDGRCDIHMSIDNRIYIVEIKMGDAQKAIDQIESRQYYMPYLDQNKKITLLGIGIDESKRNIGGWVSVEITVGSNGQILKSNLQEYKDETSQPEKMQEKETIDPVKEGKRQMAKQMLSDNLPIDLIIKYSGLSEEEIRSL